MRSSNTGLFFTMRLGAELQTAWIESCIGHLGEAELGAMEATEEGGGELGRRHG